jgi:glycosyltransferase domain-containing protein
VTNPNVTIVIPAFNRPSELRRLLRFLALVNNPYPVLLLDGSDLQTQNRNQEFSKGFTGVTWSGYDPGFHLGMRLADGVKNITTEFIVFCGDDDFLVPEGISTSAKFLSEHPDYSCAIGQTLCLSFNRRRAGVSFIDHLRNPFRLDQDTFLPRFLSLLALTNAGCSPFYYGVHRTEQIKAIYSRVVPSLKYTSLELFSNIFTALNGKGVALPVLSHFRDYSSEAIREEQREDLKFYFTESDIRYIRSIFLPELRKKEALSEEVSNYVIELALGLPLKEVQPSIVTAFWLKPRYRLLRVITTIASLVYPSAVTYLWDVDAKYVRALTKAQSDCRI